MYLKGVEKQYPRISFDFLSIESSKVRVSPRSDSYENSVPFLIVFGKKGNYRAEMKNKYANPDRSVRIGKS